MGAELQKAPQAPVAGALGSLPQIVFCVTGGRIGRMYLGGSAGCGVYAANV